MTKLKAGKRLQWWWCGDDECDCTRPIIEELIDDGFYRYGEKSFTVHEVEEGPFVSYGAGGCPSAEEIAAQKQWAMDACARHGCLFYAQGETLPA